MTKPEEYHGHITFEDGSHAPLTAEMAQALWDAAEQAKKASEDAMPTEADALRQFFQARTRLEDFGWRDPRYMHHFGECDAIEGGSTGIHRIAYCGDWPTGDWYYRDEIDTADPWLAKPASDASDDAIADARGGGGGVSEATTSDVINTLSDGEKRVILRALKQPDGSMKLRSPVPASIMSKLYFSDLIDPGYVLSALGLEVMADLELRRVA